MFSFFTYAIQKKEKYFENSNNHIYKKIKIQLTMEPVNISNINQLLKTAPFSIMYEDICSTLYDNGFDILNRSNKEYLKLLKKGEYVFCLTCNKLFSGTIDIITNDYMLLKKYDVDTSDASDSNTDKGESEKGIINISEIETKDIHTIFVKKEHLIKVDSFTSSLSFVDIMNLVYLFIALVIYFVIIYKISYKIN